MISMIFMAVLYDPTILFQLVNLKPTPLVNQWKGGRMVALVGASLRVSLECLLVATDADEGTHLRGKPMLNILQHNPPLILIGNHIENIVASNHIKLTLIEVIALEVERVVLLEVQTVSIKPLATTVVKALVAGNTVKETVFLQPRHGGRKGLAGHCGQMGFVHTLDYSHFQAIASIFLNRVASST